MDRFLKSVERKAFRMIQIATGNADDSLDLLQDSMMKFVRHYSEKPEQEWKPLFYKVVQNRIRDWYRREKIKSVFFSFLPGQNRDHHGPEFDPIQTSEDRKNPDSFTQVKTSQAMKTLESALKQLPQRQQQVFLLRAWEELSVKQTAQAMNCSQGTVKTHYSRAVGKLKKQLEGVWP